MKRIIPKSTLVCILFLLLSCGTRNASIPKNDEQAFNTYWNTGEAEITSYSLTQSSDGEMHNGIASLVFVIEDFSKSRLGKLSEPKKHRADAIRVMKLNASAEFISGIFESNQMSSVFSPIEYKENPHCLKLVSSSQDWSGQSYFQANWKGHRYEIKNFDYTREESESEASLVNTWIEEEVWTKIRISPDELPVGKIKMLPAAFYLHHSNHPIKVYDAEASVTAGGIDFIYTLAYPELNRKLEIHFGKDFPHRILSWKESIGGKEVVNAVLHKTLRTAFWNHTQTADETLRDSLNLN